MEHTNYWNHNGKYQLFVAALQALVPMQDEVPDAKQNPALEKFRKASNCYYDLYNNGLCNRAAEFAKVFGIASGKHKFRDGRHYDFFDRLYDLTEVAMDNIILRAAEEQKLLHLLDSVGGIA